MRTFLNQATALSGKTGKPGSLAPRTLRELDASDLKHVSGGLSPLGEVLKIVQGGGSVPPKKP